MKRYSKRKLTKSMNTGFAFGKTMQARKYWSAIFLPLFSCQFILCVLSCSCAIAADKPPNVVLIFVDDLGYGDLGCYGATKVQTPNIDKLAAEGRRFTDAHSASAVCTPSRYGLLTGEYPVRRNIWGPAPETSPLLVDTDRRADDDTERERDG